MIDKNVKKSVLPFIFIAGLLLIMTPVLISLFRGSDFLLSEESYYHLRIIDQYKNTGEYTQDLLLDRSIEVNGFYFILSFLGFPDLIIVYMIPLILGLLCMFLFYILLKDLGIKEDVSIFSLIFLISAPIFIYTFTTINTESFYLFMLLVSIILFFKKNYLVIIFSGILAFLSIVYFILFIFLILAYMFYKNFFDKKLFYFSLGFGVVVLMLSFLLIGKNPFLSISFNSFSLSAVLISLGGVKAFSVITLVLFLIGIFILWRRDFKFLLVSLLSLLILVASFYLESLRVFVILEIAVFSGISVKQFIIKKWNVYWLKEVILLIIICSLIFASLVFMKYETSFITDDYVAGFKFLKTVDKDDVVFSYYDNGFMIQKIAGRKTFWDSYSSIYSDFDDKKALADEIFYTRDLKDLRNLLISEKISHIFIDERMINGLVWNGPDEGVLFLLRNSKDFVKVFNNDAVTIYRFVE